MPATGGYCNNLRFTGFELDMLEGICVKWSLDAIQDCNFSPRSAIGIIKSGKPLSVKVGVVSLLDNY